VAGNDANGDWLDPWHGRHVDHDPPGRVVWRDGDWRPPTVIGTGQPVPLWEQDLSPLDSYGPVKRQAALLFRRGLTATEVLAQLRDDLPGRSWSRITADTLWTWCCRHKWRPTARRVPREAEPDLPVVAPPVSAARWRCCGQVRPGACPVCGTVSPLASG
jgi:hypothetical protein